LEELFPDGENRPPKLAAGNHQSTVMNSLANAYSLSGQPLRAIPLFKAYISNSEGASDYTNSSIGLANIAYMAQGPTGALHAAKNNLQSSVKSGELAHNPFTQAVGYLELGHLAIYLGDLESAEKNLDISLQIFQMIDATKDWISKNWAYRSELATLKLDYREAVECAKTALKFSELDAKEDFPVERDFIKSYWLLGSIARLQKDNVLSDKYLNEALIRNRASNLVEIEANILLDLARLRYDQKKYEEAKSLADEALSITERCGYVLQGADVNLFLAQYALEQEKDKVKAKQYAEEAKKLATCDGPPYYYKVAYEEAERFLENL
jgi:tetratricopeptide (TPR) repeat protein